MYVSVGFDAYIYALVIKEIFHSDSDFTFHSVTIYTKTNSAQKIGAK